MNNSKYTELPTTSRRLPENHSPCTVRYAPKTTGAENGPNNQREEDKGDREVEVRGETRGEVRGEKRGKVRIDRVRKNRVNVRTELGTKKKIKHWTQRLHRWYKSLFVGSITDAEVAGMIRAYGKPLRVFRSHREYFPFSY